MTSTDQLKYRGRYIGGRAVDLGLGCFAKCPLSEFLGAICEYSPPNKGFHEQPVSNDYTSIYIYFRGTFHETPHKKGWCYEDNNNGSFEYIFIACLRRGTIYILYNSLYARGCPRCVTLRDIYINMTALVTLLLYNVLPINWYTGNVAIKCHSKCMGDNRDPTGVLHQEISSLPVSIASNTRCF